VTGVVEVYRRWPTHEACIQHLEQVRWGESPTCPYCNSEKVSRHREASRDDRWQCQPCRKSFSVTVGTIFHKSHVDLQRWFLLISLMMAAKKGLSSMQAARDLEIRQGTAWSMMHRIRRALADDGKLLAGIVEMDETYVGGKPRKANRRSDDPPGGQGVTTRDAGRLDSP
jgi:transposase-like protein